MLVTDLKQTFIRPAGVARRRVLRRGLRHRRSPVLSMGERFYAFSPGVARAAAKRVGSTKAPTLRIVLYYPA